MEVSPDPRIPPVFHSTSGGETLGTPGGIVDYRLSASVGDQVKKKRGRPRKYGPDGVIRDLGIISSAMAGSSGNPHYSPSSGSEIVKKRARGRPPGSGKKQQLAALGIFFNLSLSLSLALPLSRARAIA